MPLQLVIMTQIVLLKSNNIHGSQCSHKPSSLNDIGGEYIIIEVHTYSRMKMASHMITHFQNQAIQFS